MLPARKDPDHPEPLRAVCECVRPRSADRITRRRRTAAQHPSQTVPVVLIGRSSTLQHHAAQQNARQRVGYTNVGKSTIANLSKSEVFAENKPLPPLDTTVRKVVVDNLPVPPCRYRRTHPKLPTDLVDSLRVP